MPSSTLPTPRWTPHIPSCPAKKTDCKGLDTRQCNGVPGTGIEHLPSHKDLGAHPRLQMALGMMSHPVQGSWISVHHVHDLWMDIPDGVCFLHSCLN